MLSLTISKTKKYDSIKHVNGRFVVLNEEINGWKIITRGANTYNLQNKNGTLAFPHENFASIEFSDGFYTAIKKNVVLSDNYRLKDNKAMLCLERNIFRIKKDIFEESQDNIDIINCKNPSLKARIFCCK